jgi:hypothetical protein
MMKIQDAFLSYANNLFKDDPDYIYLPFESIFRSISKPLKPILGRIISYYRYKELSSKIDEMLAAAEKQQPLSVDAVKTAVEAVFAYRNGYCEDHCPFRSERMKKIGEARYTGSERVTCLDCDQLNFMHLLSEFSRGRGLPEIEAFIRLGQDMIKTTANLKNTEKNVAVFQKAQFIHSSGLISLGGKKDYKFAFHDYLYGYVSYSLGEFLRADSKNRKKIGQCRNCNNFYIAKTVQDSFYCSSSCRNTYKNRKN